MMLMGCGGVRSVGFVSFLGIQNHCKEKKSRKVAFLHSCQKGIGPRGAGY